MTFKKLALLFGAAILHAFFLIGANAQQGAINTYQLNRTFFVAQAGGFLPTIQSAVTTACATVGGTVNIQAGISPPDTIGAVTGGCTTVGIVDQRVVPSVQYAWNGTAYVAASSGGSVTAVGVASANGVSGTSSGGATPALTISLGAITPGSIKLPSSSVLAGTSGTSTTLATFLGSHTTGDLVMFNAAGDIVDTGGLFSNIPTLSASNLWAGSQNFRAGLALVQLSVPSAGTNFNSPTLGLTASFCISSSSCSTSNDSWGTYIALGTGFNPTSTYMIAQGSGGSTGAHTVNIPVGSTEGGTIVGGNLTGASAICVQGSACNAVTIENVFAAAGTINYTHNLNTVNPLVTCYVKSGSPIANMAAPDANDMAITTTGAADILCAFGYAPPAPPGFGFLVTGSPAVYVPSLAATQTLPLTVIQNAVSGYTASTTYSLSGLPSGVTGALATNPITGGSGTSTLTMSFPYNQASGSNAFTVSGVGGGITHTQAPVINVATTNTGLVGGWPMNEGTATTFHDVVAANNATFTSGVATWGTVTGFGSASVPTFAGTGQAITTSTTAVNFAGSTPFSVSLWAELTNVSAVHTLVSTVSTSAAGTPGWELSTSTSGQLQFYLYQTIVTNGLSVTSPTSSLSAGAIHHIVMTYSGATKTASDVSLYIDGVLKTGTATWNTFTGSAAGSQPLTFGARADNSDPLVGTEAFARIFSRVLSSSEVTTLFSAGPQ